MNKKISARMTFTRRLLLSMLLVSMVPVIIVGMISHNAARDTILNLAYDANNRTVESLTQQLDLRLSQMKSLINSVAANQEIINILDNPRQTEFDQMVAQSKLGVILASYSSLSGLVSIDIFDVDNTHYHAGDTLSMEATLPEVRDELYDATVSNGIEMIYWAGIEKNVNFNSTNKLVITIAKIITKTDPQTFQPKPIALLLVNNNLTDIYTSFSQIEMENGSFAMVVDNQNKVIYHPDAERLGSTVSSDLMDRMTSQKGSFSQNVTGELEIFTYSTSTVSGWKTIVVTPVRALTSPADAIGGYTLIVIAIMLVVVFFVSSFVSKYVVQPVLRITDRIKQYQKGDPGWKIPLPETGSDEIGDLTRWFNSFQSNLKARQQAEDSLHRQSELQAGIAQAMTLIVTDDESDDSFSKAIAILGQSMHVDRAYFYEVGPANENLPMTLLVRNSWRREGVTLPTIGDILVNDYSTPTLIRWYSILSQGKPIDGTAESFTVTDRTLLRQWGIQSILLVPILVGGSLWGLLGFDDCFTMRSWADFEKSLLKTAGIGFASVYTRKRALERLAARETQLRLISDNIVDIIGLNDLKGNFIYISPSVTRTTGYTPEEILQKPVSSWISLDEISQVRERILKPIQEGRLPDVIQFHLRAKDGRIIWLETHAEMVEFNNQQVILTSSRDVTQRRLAQEELAASVRQSKLLAASADAANRSKNELLASMSREIRTPMNTILGVAGLLEKTELSRDQSDYVKTIRESGDALLGVVNNILDYSRIEAGKLNLEEFDFSLRECLESSFDLVKSKASAKKLEADYWMEGDVPERVRGDMSRLRQILVHLLDNAVKFTDQGRISVHVSCHPELDDALHTGLHFSVIDTGIGLTQEQQDRIFKPFGLANGVVTRKLIGGGLGLTISHSIVSQMGGRMWVVSSGRPGEGAAFHFVVQLGMVHSAADESKPYTGKSALLIDEDLSGHPGMLQQTLQNWGMECRVFNSIAEASQAVDGHNRVDLVFINYPALVTPGQWDISALKRQAGLSDTPFVASTLWGVSLQESEKELFSGLLARPIQKKALLDLLRKLLGGNESQSAITKKVITASVENITPVRILMVEDDTLNLQVNCSLLEELGYQVITAASGAEAVQLIQEQPVDLILMDLQMPEMDGFETARAIRGLRSVPRKLYILGMAPEQYDGIDQACRDAGINAFILKPLEAESLREAVQAGLEESRSALEPVDSSKRENEAAHMLSRLVGLVGKEGDAELSEITRLYCTDMQKNLQAVRQAFDENDWAKVQQHAHALKSASLMIGAERMGEYARQLEAIARGIRTGDEPSPSIPELMGKLQWEQEYLVSVLPGLKISSN